MATSLDYLDVLCLHGNGTDASTTFTDDSPADHGNATVVGSAQVDTAYKKFGTGSIYLPDSSTDYIYFSDAEMGTHHELDSEDFTMDFWLKVGTAGGTSTVTRLFGRWDGTSNNCLWQVSLTWNSYGRYQIKFYWNINNTDYTNPDGTCTDGEWRTPTDDWFHIAVTRNRYYIRLYVNGQRIATSTIYSTEIWDNSGAATTPLRIGSGSANSEIWIDELRFSKGVDRYDGESSFTLETEEYDGGSSSSSSSSSSSASSSSSSSSYSSRSSSSSSSSSAASTTFGYYIKERHGLNPNTLLEVTTNTSGDKKRFSKKRVSSSTPSSVYSVKLLSVGSTTHKLENWEGGMDTSTISVVIGNVGKGSMDSDILSTRSGSRLINKEAEVKLHISGTPIEMAKPVFKGKIKNDKETLGKWSLSLADTRNKYTKNIPDTYFNEEDFPEVEDDAIGTVIPFLIGTKKNIKPIQSDTINQTFKVSALPLHSISAVYDFGNEITPLSSSLADGTFTLDDVAFTIEDTLSDSNLLNITEGFINSLPSNPSADTLGEDLTDIRVETIGSLVDYINNKTGYNATLVGSASIASTRLAPVSDVQIASGPVSILLQSPEAGTISCDATGCYDTPTGKYTGTANSPITQPGDIIYFIANSICGMPDEKIDVQSFKNLRQHFTGFSMGKYIKTPEDAFATIQEIAREAYVWCYWDSNTNKLTVKNADPDLEESITDYYYEDLPFPKILANSFSRVKDERDIINKIDVLYDYDEALNAYNGLISIESPSSQSESTGYGVTTSAKITGSWLLADFPAMRITYDGIGYCSLEVTGEGTDEEVRFKTHINSGGSETEFDLNLVSASFDSINKLVAKINNDSDYTAWVNSDHPEYGSLDSRGLRDIDNKLVGDYLFLDDYFSYGIGDGKFKSIHDVCIQGSYLYVADYVGGKIAKIQLSDMSWVDSFNYASGDIHCKGITANSAYLYLADYDGSRVVRTSIGTFGSFIDDISSAGLYDFDRPFGICCDDSNVWVTDAGINRLVKLDETLSYASEVGSPNSHEVMYRPVGIETDGTYIYIADYFNHRIHKRNASTLALVTYYDTAIGNADYLLPSRITVAGEKVYCQCGKADKIFTLASADMSLVNVYDYPENYISDKGFEASGDVMYQANSSRAKIDTFAIGGVSQLDYSVAKLVGRKILSQRKDTHDRISFRTSLVGLNQRLGDVIGVRRLDDTSTKRVRVTQVTKDLNNYTITIAGKQEGVDLDSGLVARYSMSDSTGADLTDSSGNGYDLTPINNPTQEGGGIIKFTAADTEYYSLAHASSGRLDISGDDNLSIVGRVKMNYYSGLMWFVSKTDGKGGYRVGTYNGRLYFQLYDGTSSTTCAANTQFTIGKWFTFAFTYNGSEIRAYFNGNLDESDTNPIAFSGTVGACTADFQVGASGGTGPLDGELDYLGIFDIGLDYEEVINIHTYWN